MLIAISIVRNEADRYLRDWLANVATYADRHVVLDDGSDDRTVAILLERATIDPRLTIEANDSSIFAEREQMLRAQSWELARRVARPGDWIIIVDADEFFDGEMVARKTDLLARPESRVRMRRLDLWAEDLYRVDGYWSAAYSPMFRFQDLPFGATGPGLNESPLPAYARDPSAAVYRSAVRCLHKGWLRDEDKRRKHEFYLQHVQRPFDRRHVRSSLERSPRLRRYHADYRCLAAKVARARFATRERTGEWIRPPLRFAHLASEGRYSALRAAVAVRRRLRRRGFPGPAAARSVARERGDVRRIRARHVRVGGQRRDRLYAAPSGHGPNDSRLEHRRQ